MVYPFGVKLIDKCVKGYANVYYTYYVDAARGSCFLPSRGDCT